LNLVSLALIETHLQHV